MVQLHGITYARKMPAFRAPYQIEKHKTLQTELVLKLSATLFAQLHSLLQQAENDEYGIQLQLDSAMQMNESIHDEWMIAWKVREQGTRCLLGHPDPGKWAAMVILARDDFNKLLSLLEKAQSFNLGEIVTLNPPSNLHIRFELKL